MHPSPHAKASKFVLSCGHHKSASTITLPGTRHRVQHSTKEPNESARRGMLVLLLPLAIPSSISLSSCGETEVKPSMKLLYTPHHAMQGHECTASCLSAVQGSWTIAWPRLLMPAGAGISSAASFPRAASPAMAVPAAPDDGLRTSRAPVRSFKAAWLFFKCFKQKNTNILKSANSYLMSFHP